MYLDYVVKIEKKNSHVNFNAGFQTLDLKK